MKFGHNVRVKARHGARADGHEERVDGGHVLGRVQDNHPENAESQDESIWCAQRVPGLSELVSSRFPSFGRFRRIPWVIW